MAILKTLYRDDLETRDNPLPHHKVGAMYTRSGYGRRIPTPTQVRLPGSSRWRRVYCCIHSNIGTCYVLQGRDWIAIA